ncbi:M56 family metallopeptidase [Mediterranea massiliensis]|uniref:M56 family metallopeptidase n=1 Tax=Mediterranea massiliensis TaxID=1841865 RepID=UPI0025A3DA76|nr:M56 family metallopeptidase [Mediterranea massiliensis]MDM8336782.1 M56 family metallopeptidase [Mediterranea massiliensis]
MVYFLKVNVAIALFYAFYRLFFYKDTFFAWRRTALMCFFAVSAAVPLFNIQTWIVQQEPMVAMADLYAAVVLPEITLTPQPQMDWKQLLVQGIGIVYWLVVALLALRFVVQLAGIFRLARRCPVQEIDGTTVHLLPRAEGPFSFFRWIFVCPGAHSREELNEILTHERTHVCQWHSIDVLVGELACIVCWFNPFAWLMKREIRTNLEYMADEKVLETGYDSRTYQYHLLGLSHHKAAATIYNSFNVLPLKRRITMMNKRRTREIGRTKYLMFLPLAALLMIVSNIEAVARATQKIASEVIESVKPDETSAVQAQSQSQGTVTTQSQTALTRPQQGKPEKVTYKGKLTDEAGNPLGDVQIITDRKFQSTTVSTVNTDGEFRVETSSEAGIIFEYTGKDGRKLMRGYRADELAKMGPDNLVIVLIPVVSSPHEADPNVFEVVEKMPEFPNGGMPGLMKYLSDNIRYPEAAKVAGIQGRVTVVFVVDKDGSITNVKTLRGVDAELDKEAIRVISSMPKWIPGMQKGKAVKVRYTVPVMFRLPNKPVEGKVNEIVVKGVAKPSDNVTGDVYEAVEQMPEFPGGMAGLMQYITKNLRYPEEAKAKGIQGRVTVRVVVNTEGKVTNAEVLRGVDPALDAEALRVASSLPDWKPGMQDGKPVNVRFIFPVNFSLQ